MQGEQGLQGVKGHKGDAGVPGKNVSELFSCYIFVKYLTQCTKTCYGTDDFNSSKFIC